MIQDMKTILILAMTMSTRLVLDTTPRIPNQRKEIKPRSKEECSPATRAARVRFPVDAF
jgi:hypothetical protein